MNAIPAPCTRGTAARIPRRNRAGRPGRGRQPPARAGRSSADEAVEGPGAFKSLALRARTGAKSSGRRRTAAARAWISVSAVVRMTINGEPFVQHPDGARAGPA